MYRGDVIIDLWDLETRAEVLEFRRALASIDGVHDVIAHTLRRQVVRFEMDVAQPIALLAELQACAHEALFIRDASPGNARLEVFRDR